MSQRTLEAREHRARSTERLHRFYRCLATFQVLVVLAAVAPPASDAAERMTLEDANRRWEDARCRSRIAIPLKGTTNRDGVAKSRWLFYDEEGGNHRARFYFSNGEALLHRYRHDVIPAGTEFISLGWREEKPGKAIFLSVELPGTPIRGKLFYQDDWVGDVEVGRLDDFERWVRFDVFEIVETPDEALVDVRAAGEPPPTGSPRAAPPTSVGPATAFTPQVRLHAVAVQPPQVAPGDEVLLVVSYEVAGLPSGAPFEVAERRRLMHGDRQIETFSENVVRRNGSFTSKLPVRIPESASPGVYALAASVQLAGLEATGEAVFEVRRRSP